VTASCLPLHLGVREQIDRRAREHLQTHQTHLCSFVLASVAGPPTQVTGAPRDGLYSALILVAPEFVDGLPLLRTSYFFVDE